MIDKIIKLSEENANYDIVKYGLICLLNGTVSFFIIVALGIISNRIIKTLLYLVCNLFISTKVGGYHSKTPLGCIILTIITWRIAVSDCFNKILGGEITIFVLYIVCSFFVYFFSPVLHPNKVIFQKEEKQRIKFYSIEFTLLWFLITMFLYSINKQNYAGCMLVCYLEMVVSMLIGKEVYRKNEKKDIKSNCQNCKCGSQECS